MVLEEKYFPRYALLTDEISFPDCLYFLRYWAIMCIVIIYLLVSDFINFQINLSFFIKLFYYMIKSQDKH